MNKMERTLRSEGLNGNHLFLVEGDLVANYNKALKLITGKETAQPRFFIDKRGESPELEAELGQNYLQCGPANRYIIVLSPDQKDSELMHEEFSFDREFLDQFYQQYLPGIELVSRVDVLYGPISTGVQTYSSLEDLLLIEEVKTELKSPSGFIESAVELQGLTEKLRANPSLLVENDSEAVKKMLELIGKVGDVRGYDIDGFNSKKDVSSFFTRLYGGVHVFRDEIYANKTTVVYNDTEAENWPENSPKVTFISISQKDTVIDFLVKNDHAYFSEELIKPRLDLLMDITLVSQGYDVASLNTWEKLRAIGNVKAKDLPQEWQELNTLQTSVAKGYDFDKLVKKASAEVKAMLLVPSERYQENPQLVGNLMTKLWDHDYKRMYAHNKRDLEHAFSAADDNLKNYIAKTVKESMIE